MAKVNKQEGTRSILKLAFEAFERGDAVKTRTLAKAVLAGQHGRDEEKVAGELAKQLSVEGAPVAPSPSSVAEDLISRTIVPARPYLFVGAITAAFVALVLLAHFRY